MQQHSITKFKCATISEAEMLGMEEAKDVLFAYQPNGPKLDRFISLIKKYPGTKYSCLIDNMVSAQELVTAIANAGAEISVYVDINVGMNRSGIDPGNSAIELLKYLSGQPCIKRVGLHIYDGHISSQSFSERESKVNDWRIKINQFIDELETAGLKIYNIIVGGSPTF